MIRKEKILSYLLILETSSAIIILLSALVIFPFVNISFKGWGTVGVLILLLVGMASTILLIGICRLVSLSYVASISPLVIVAFGVAVRIAFAVVADPHPISDGLEYISLADKLAHGRMYVDAAGYRAFWPPGYPFFLVPFLLVLGKGLKTITLVNLSLYIASSAAIYLLSIQTFKKDVAVCAVFLLAIWPNQIFATSLASKDNLVTTTLLIALASLSVPYRFPSYPKLAFFAALVAGGSLGFGALTQPSLTLLGPLLPMAYYMTALKPNQHRIKLAGMAVMGFMLVVSPWIIRNYRVFDGRFVGISTNGGSVFYRSNNELATGLWIQEGKNPLDGLSELEANKKGKEWGLVWIKDHPADALKLSVRKSIAFMGSDDFASYWAIFRGSGMDYKTAQDNIQSSSQRLFAFQIGTGLANTFWLVILAAIVLGLTKAAETKVNAGQLFLLLCPLFYLLLVHSVFESGDRHHMAAFAILFVVAASHFVHLPTNRGFPPLKLLRRQR